MSTALYRRYRPEAFADVIGQEHVTEPLMSALRGDRISHAYLFSGPRGCGKTTSARIFARCLNCEQGPTDTPCGTCPSCVDLARGGAGSLDVVEMDAASHGGVDDARELRERAAFAPARDRYKVFIIDEAHMVTNQGFNALLKLVEEPPAHVKFVFATTEPEKVIGTIRSRTHHYPFRLVPPERLQSYLEELCVAEGVQVDSGVLPLVVRAGGGSVRDSLSVLDQLIAGAQEGSIGYERAVALLGYTHATLLDDVVDAIAAVDGAALFRVVDRVIGSGHDPRRFAEDVLERLRDLIVIAVSGEHAASVLRSVPQDQVDRMRIQAQQMGPAQLSRAGDLVNEALTEMSGATSPRLQLELLCARLLLPAAGDGARGFGARLERLENQLAGGVVPAASMPPAPAPVADLADHAPSAPSQPPPTAAPATPTPPAPAPAAPASSPSGPGPQADAPTAAPGAAALTTAPGADALTELSEPAPVAPAADEQAAPQQRGPEQPDREPAASEPVATEPSRPEPAGLAVTSPAPMSGGAPQAPASTRASQEVPAPQGAQSSPAPARGGSAPVDAEMVRRRWPEVLSTLARFKRTTWALVSQNAQVGDVSGGVLQLAFSTPGLAHTFRSGSHAESLQRALLETLGVDVRIEPILGQAAQSGGGTAPGAGWGSSAPADPGYSGGGAAAAWGSAPTPPEPATAALDRDPGHGYGSAPGSSGMPSAHASGGSRGPVAATSAPTSPAAPADPQDAGSHVGPAAHDGSGAAGASSAAPARDTAPAAAHVSQSAVTAVAVPPSSASPTDWSAATPARAHVAPGDDTPSMDDPDAENSELSGARLIEKILGGTIIEETEH